MPETRERSAPERDRVAGLLEGYAGIEELGDGGDSPLSRLLRDAAALLRSPVEGSAPRGEGETELRRLLWLRHGCRISVLYGDDGEMSCGQCRIDFKRDDPSTIGAIWKRAALLRTPRGEGEDLRKAVEVVRSEMLRLRDRAYALALASAPGSPEREIHAGERVAYGHAYEELDAALRPEPTGETDDDESVRCGCEWSSPLDGEVDARWPFELDPYCRVHGEPGGWPEIPPGVPVEEEPTGETEGCSHPDCTDPVTLTVYESEDSDEVTFRACAAHDPRRGATPVPVREGEDAERRYQSAVHGRQQMRAAYREAREALKECRGMWGAAAVTFDAHGMTLWADIARRLAAGFAPAPAWDREDAARLLFEATQEAENGPDHTGGWDMLPMREREFYEEVVRIFAARLRGEGGGE